MDNRFKKIFLVFGDIFILYLSLYLALALRYQTNPTNQLWSEHLEPFSIIFIFWIAIFYLSNLYNLNLAINNLKFFKSVFKGFIFSTILSVGYFYISSSASITPKTNLIIFIIVFAVLFSVWRRLYNWALASYLPKNNIAFIGKNKLVSEIITDLKQKPHLGYHISFIIDIEENDQKIINGVPVFNNIDDLPRLIEKKCINNIIFATSPDDFSELRSILFKCLPLKIGFNNITNFYENITGRVPINTINKMWFLENLNEGNKKGFTITKKIFNIILSFLLLFITFPFWIIVAVIIKLESHGPVFFTQIRLGKNGKRFKILKFRTMKTEGNNHTPTTENDSRITAFGNFLRKSRIDELPQIINILKGEMSFIGPRPERPELVVDLEKQIPFYRERMLVDPGVTGWDQVSGEYHSPSYEDTMKKLQYDLFYIKNRSIFLDLSIILKTLKTILSRSGR